MLKKSLPLHTKIFIGLFTGLALGIFCNIFFPENANIEWISRNIANPAGQIFLRMIFMIVIPLIFTAIVSGVADFRDIKKVGRIGFKTLSFTIFISAISVVIGLTIVNIVQPGTVINPEERDSLISTLTTSQPVTGIVKSAEETKSLIEIIVDLIPRNPFADIVYAFDPNYRGGGLLALMFFSLMFGIAMAVTDQDKISGLTGVLHGLYEVIMKIIDFAMKLAPYGVAGLIFVTSYHLGLQIISILFLYVAVVITALLFHFFGTYGIIIKYALKRNPAVFFKEISGVIITAFSTSSSNATLPTTIRTSIEKLKLDKDISNFVLTVGSTANQNGTALYEGITVLFLAQFYGIDLTFIQQLLVVFLSILAGIGTAGVPGGSLPLVVGVLQVIGVPAEGIGIILGVDRVLDMSRTVVNVTGDIVLAGWIDSTEKRNKIQPISY